MKRNYYDKVLKESLTGVKNVYNSFFYRFRMQLIVIAILLPLIITSIIVINNFNKRNDFSVTKTTVFYHYHGGEVDTMSKFLHSSKISDEAFKEQIDMRYLNKSALNRILHMYNYQGEIDDSPWSVFLLVNKDGELINVYVGAGETLRLRQDLVNLGYLQVSEDE